MKRVSLAYRDLSEIPRDFCDNHGADVEELDLSYNRIRSKKSPQKRNVSLSIPPPVQRFASAERAHSSQHARARQKRFDGARPIAVDARTPHALGQSQSNRESEPIRRNDRRQLSQFALSLDDEQRRGAELLQQGKRARLQ